MNGYTETDEHVEWRMNRRRLQNIEAVYGAGWESDADAVRQLLENVEQPHPVERAYQLEQAMDEEYPFAFSAGDVFEVRPYRPATSDGDLPF